MPSKMSKTYRALALQQFLPERCYVVSDNKARIYFQLSEPPPIGWSHMFRCLWEATDTPLEASAGTEGDTLWVECPPDEVRSIIVPWLGDAVKETNLRYAAAVDKVCETERSQLASEIQTQAKLDALIRSFAPLPEPGTPESGASTGPTDRWNPFRWVGRSVQVTLNFFRPPTSDPSGE